MLNDDDDLVRNVAVNKICKARGRQLNRRDQQEEINLLEENFRGGLIGADEGSDDDSDRDIAIRTFQFQKYTMMLKHIIKWWT